MRTTLDNIKFMSDRQLRQLLDDYASLEKNGFLGDGALRQKYDECMQELGNPSPTLSFGITSQLIAFEAARALAEKYLEEHPID